jgi:hypothetical protein
MLAYQMGSPNAILVRKYAQEMENVIVNKVSLERRKLVNVKVKSTICTKTSFKIV